MTTEQQRSQAAFEWYGKKLEEVLQELHVDVKGLSSEETKRRLEQYGANTLPEAKTDSLLAIFIRQFKSPLIYLLMAAAAVVFLIEEYVDGYIIVFVLLFNAVVGTIQAGKAQNTMLALRRFTKTSASVLRDGKEIVVADSELVPGDVILLQEGEKVPADARLIEARNLRVNEAALTGESEPVGKHTDVVEAHNVPVGDQKNMIFKGTFVAAGNARAVVVATGLHTIIGAISKKVAQIDTEIPLQVSIRRLSQVIMIAVLVISAIIFALGLYEGQPLEEIFVLSVAVIVSAIPEGLPIVMTLLLATGVWRMSKENVLVKKLQAVEALGEAKIIAVDKTGTLTKGELVVQSMYVDGNVFEVEGVGYEQEGRVLHEGKPFNVQRFPGLALAGTIGILASNARITFLEEENQWSVAGDPTEAALAIVGGKLDFDQKVIRDAHPRIDEAPFDSSKQYHAVLNKKDDAPWLTVTGSPEAVLAMCKPLPANQRESMEEVIKEMSSRGLRVLAFAHKENAADSLAEETMDGLTFGGLYGMKDALKAEVFGAMKATREEGIRVVMITGDHALTAEAIGRDAGIFKEGDKVLTGSEMESMDDAALAEAMEGVTVFARVTPEHKLRIIDAYRLRGEIIAMTGDGVNDALSLVAADLGVAMGKGGTEVAKEAADLVLLDDNFGSIVSAIEEGRRIFNNAKKVLLYLLTTSLGEIVIILTALILGWPVPLVAAQLIWLNLVTDGVLDVALAMEPQENKPIREKFVTTKWIIDKWMLTRMAIMTITMSIATIVLFGQYYEMDLTKAMTIAVTTMAAFQWKKAWNCRSDSQSVFRMGLFTNKYILGATILAISLHVFAVYTPFMQAILSFTPLTLAEWALCVGVAFSTIMVDETSKFFRRRYLRKMVAAETGNFEVAPAR